MLDTNFYAISNFNEVMPYQVRPPSLHNMLRRLQKSLIALLIVVCGNCHPRSAAFI